jgi:rhodanese-related sulfurtransferase
MWNFLKNLLGFGPKIDYTELLRQGAVVLDVRTKTEYGTGHIKGSVNIPLDQLYGSLAKLKDKNQPIITCCASGMRSDTAKHVLKSKGYTQVYNGGGWSSLLYKIK